MLKNLHPLLNADVLYALRAMGHGDESCATPTSRPTRWPARRYWARCCASTAWAPPAARAILSVLPLDNAVEQPVRRMEIMGEPATIPPVQQELQHEVNQAEGRERPLGSIERFAFYEAAKKAYCVIATGERRFYGCFLLKKGVLPPEA
jgi:L-fucose mutarotase